MVFLTGDTHGSFSRINDFCIEEGTTQDDTMVILGDSGINYTSNEALSRKLKQGLGKMPITLFNVHGNHEERPEKYPYGKYIEKEWNGGIVYVEEEYPNLLFAKDGEIYDINGKKTIIIGGAYSVDKYYRIKWGFNWFESEQPDEKIKEHVESVLEQHNWKIDAVFSHTCPYKYIPKHLFLDGIDQSTVDNATEKWLDSIEDRLEYKAWYFGHFHGYYQIDKMTMLFEEIIKFD